jgi:hypothetical protein
MLRVLRTHNTKDCLGYNAGDVMEDLHSGRVCSNLHPRGTSLLPTLVATKTRVAETEEKPDEILISVSAPLSFVECIAVCLHHWQ